MLTNICLLFVMTGSRGLCSKSVEVVFETLNILYFRVNVWLWIAMPCDNSMALPVARLIFSPQ